jgi:hypothetical protein
VLGRPSIEGVWNCVDRVPDNFLSGSSQNITTALTNRTASDAFESSGFTITVTSRSGQSTGVPTAFPAPLVVTVTANNPNEPSAGVLVSLAPTLEVWA